MPDVVIRIFFITSGAVSPNDFYDLETMPPDIEALLDPQNPRHKKLRAELRLGHKPESEVA